jgi:hypothetical protein
LCQHTWLYGLPAHYEQVALEGHTDNVTSCVWNPDGTRLATASSAVTKTVGGRAALRVCCGSPPTVAHRQCIEPARSLLSIPDAPLSARSLFLLNLPVQLPVVRVHPVRAVLDIDEYEGGVSIRQAHSTATSGHAPTQSPRLLLLLLFSGD